MTKEEFLNLVSRHQGVEKFKSALSENSTIELHTVCGSFLSLVGSAVIRDLQGIHMFLMSDRDEASYLYSDLSNFFPQDRVLLFPSSYKRSVQYKREDTSGVLQRTAVFNAVKNYNEGPLLICSYPEAVIEKVVDRSVVERSTFKISVGDRVSVSFLNETLAEFNFQKVDFVYEPGQYSIRGGIVDVFSFSENRPFRIDFFGDEVDSLRVFDISDQLSTDKVDSVEVIANLKYDNFSQKGISIAKFIDKFTVWINDPNHTLRRLDDIRKKMIEDISQEGGSAQEVETKLNAQIISRKVFVEDTAQNKMVLIRGSLNSRKSENIIDFESTPQKSFNKQFDLLASDIRESAASGVKTYILSENKAQVERLSSIFNSIGENSVLFENVDITLHEGFSCPDLKANFYTDHQLFDRYHRYKIHNDLDRSGAITVAELNALNIGDYVVHIDHGVGRFGGLVRSVENGKTQEFIKLVYRDNDVLLVNVHALHKISKYKDKDSEPPKVYKLGSGAWQRLKQATKKHVKDIAKELILLYAKRKKVRGFAFAPDTYLQHELEASFIYEDTPDQQKATEAIKTDMESPVPMDRLVCGDVGFGKTELAIRAAFKAVCDGKQVAVLVPTTVLSLQHYRTFSSRLKDFPVKVENLSRSKATKQVNEILKELEAGKIDILVGTHKILGKNVKFKDLGLLIIDEEQKFGVSAKERLRSLKLDVDTLTLSATPIPRTLQFSLMGSRDLSVITTPPANRQSVNTEVHLYNDDILKEAIEYELSRQGQVYFLHNRVEDIESIAYNIRSLVPTARVAVGHGQMPPEKLEKLIMDFIYGEYDILVATTIIENGLDIPNANTIIINNAQNFGLSDLHQLRGRVGRSNRKAFCYLLIPNEDILTPDARRRLRAIEEFSDLGSGFNIAMQDLDIRGAGNLFGAEQSGFISDIGFETYQKILKEAMTELHSEMGDQVEDQSEKKDISYISDCQIEVDFQAYIPEDYVSNVNEKIRLYREIDNLGSEEDIDLFITNLRDRFGDIPTSLMGLFNIVRIRLMAVKLGFERIIVKNGIFILHFINNQNSPYYKSNVFSSVLSYLSANPKTYKLRNNGNRLSISYSGVKDVDQALKLFRELYSYVFKPDK